MRRSFGPGLASAPALALVLALLAACNPPDAGPRFFGAGAREPGRGGVLRFAVIDNVRTLDPAIAYDEYSLYAGTYLYDTLLGYEPAVDATTGTSLEPHLAESFTLAPDGRVYAFTLRPDLRFSDGRPCVAGDFKYALERVLAEPTSPFPQFITGIEGAAAVAAGQATEAAGIRVLDDRHLEIHLVEPDASFPYVLAMKFATPLSRAYIESLAAEDVRRSPLGTGPFVLEHWSEGERLVFARNPHYWDPNRPYLDGLIMIESLTRDTAFLKFQSGELDTLDRLPSPDYIFVAGHPGWQPFLYSVPRMDIYGAKLNCARPPFSDKRVRQAFNYALNKDHQVKLHNGRAIPAHGMLPPRMPGYNSALAPYPHDPARARALLREAYPQGLPRLQYVTNKDEETEKLAQAMVADLAEVGVEVDIVLTSWATFLTATGKRDVEFALASWLMDYPDPSNFVDVKFHSRMIAEENSNNDAFYSNPKLDAMLDAARRELDPDERVRRYRDIDELLHDEAPWVWNYHTKWIELRQPYVMGYHPHPIWLRDYTHTWLDLDDDGRPVTR
jgi:ABC-type transport system substrate-binding protein